MKNNTKNDINIVKTYFINSFYNDPDIRYSIKKIHKDTNVNRDNIKLVVDMLKKKKLINNNYEFKLNLETIEFLEANLPNTRKFS